MNKMLLLYGEKRTVKLTRREKRTLQRHQEYPKSKEQIVYFRHFVYCILVVLLIHCHFIYIQLSLFALLCSIAEKDLTLL